jgi:hypothetical protein
LVGFGRFGETKALSFSQFKSRLVDSDVSGNKIISFSTFKSRLMDSDVSGKQKRFHFKRSRVVWIRTFRGNKSAFIFNVQEMFDGFGRFGETKALSFSTFRRPWMDSGVSEKQSAFIFNVQETFDGFGRFGETERFHFQRSSVVGWTSHIPL